MPVIPAVITVDCLQWWPQFFGWMLGVPADHTDLSALPNPLVDPRIKFFKVGEGGWQDPGSGKRARTPDNSLRRLSAPLIQDLDCIVDPTRASIDQRYPSDSRAYFKKNLISTDFTFEAPNVLKVRCTLDYSEFNDDGFGNYPEIWEIGVFADHPTIGGLAADQGLMIAYGTFPLESKTPAKQIENYMRLVF